MREVLAGKWNQSRPEDERCTWSEELNDLLPRPCCRYMTEEMFNGLCKECDPKSVGEAKKYTRCSSDCWQLVPSWTSQDPQTKFDKYVRKKWHVTYKRRYLRRREETESPEECFGHASVFTDP
ncbi:hypothetical protein PG993_002557 [Apiospora rasikravindrae]|uniref:Uncharacterized protein n=1 Tax=Apiospora rasikravindrae TaxID=990691 RepID=A0ABR1TXD9_9PEZI